MPLRIGKKQMEQLACFATSAVGYGGAGFLGLLYFTDWRLFLDYMPYYNTKFPPHEEEPSSSGNI